MYRENASNLGDLVSMHPCAREWVVRLALLSVVLITLGVGLAAWMTNGFAPHNHASFRSATEQWTVSLVLGGIVAGSGIACGIALLVTRTARARVYEQGVELESLGKTQTVRWADVVWFWKHETITNNVEHNRYAVADANGRRLTIPWRLAHVRDVGQRIERELRERRLPLVREAHTRGDVLSFGDLALTPTGLTRKKKSIVWKDISAVRIDNRYVSVWPHGASGAWASVRTAEVPNVEIFASLLHDHVRVAR